MCKCEYCGAPFTPIRKTNPNRFCSYRCAGDARTRASHPQLNEEYFAHIDSTEKAYWLGFILADGNICHIDTYSVRFTLSLATKDEAHLDAFIQAIGANPEKKRARRSHNSTQAAVCISNRTFCEHLIRAGCVPRKSKVVRFPTLPDSLAQALLLGYFDGDGTLAGPRRDSPVLTCGSEAFLLDVKERFTLPWKIQHYKNWFRLCLGKPLLSQISTAYAGGLSRKRLPGTLPRASP